MRLSFSTHGWCDKEWDYLVESAAINGLTGIEIASDQCDVYSKDGGPFHKYNITATVRNLRKKGVAVTVLNAGCDRQSQTDSQYQQWSVRPYGQPVSDTVHRRDTQVQQESAGQSVGEIGRAHV